MNDFYIDGKPVGTVRGAEMLEHLREMITPDEPRVLRGVKITSVIFDEFGPAQQFGRACRQIYPYVIDYDGREVNHQLLNYAAGWLWTSHRARNLSHRPVAGARKRKAALKYAARQHRVAMKEYRYV